MRESMMVVRLVCLFCSTELANRPQEDRVWATAIIFHTSPSFCSDRTQKHSYSTNMVKNSADTVWELSASWKNICSKTEVIFVFLSLLLKHTRTPQAPTKHQFPWLVKYSHSLSGMADRCQGTVENMWLRIELNIQMQTHTHISFRFFLSS